MNKTCLSLLLAPLLLCSGCVCVTRSLWERQREGCFAPPAGPQPIPHSPAGIAWRSLLTPVAVAADGVIYVGGGSLLVVTSPITVPVVICQVKSSLKGLL